MVHGRGLKPPEPIQVDASSWLVRKGRDRDPVLKGNPISTDRFQAQGGSQFRGGFRAGTSGQQKPENDVSQDETGEPAGTAQRGALSASSRTEAAGLEMALLEQMPDCRAALQLEGGGRHLRAFGRA